MIQTVGGQGAVSGARAERYRRNQVLGEAIK